MGISSNRISDALVTFLVLVMVGFLASSRAQAQRIDELQRGFERPPDDARIMMRWWWFGPAVTKPELEREMRVMKDGGIGGMEAHTAVPRTLLRPGIGDNKFSFFFRADLVQLLLLSS